MRRDLVAIAGVTAVAATFVAATRTGTGDWLQRPADPPAGSIAAPAEIVPQPQPPGPEAEIARLSEQLASRGIELAELRASVAGRDSTLAAQEAEIRSLRAELKALRERFAFELQLAAVKNVAAVVAQPAAAPDVELLPLLAAAPALPRETPMTAIHFETGSARLTPGGTAHAAAAAVMLAEMPLASIRVHGYADRTGSPARNQALAEARARAVADFLVAAGLPADRIETAGLIAPDTLPVATDPGVAEPLNRAATITPVPPPIG